MQLFKRLKNLWIISSYEPFNPFDGETKGIRKSEDFKAESNKAQIIKKDKDIIDSLNENISVR